MKKWLNNLNCIMFLFFCQSINAFSQVEKDTSKLSFALSAYLFPENTIYSHGCIALGPTLFLNDDNFSIQIGFLYNVDPYYVYERVSRFSYKTVKAHHLFLPFIINI